MSRRDCKKCLVLAYGILAVLSAKGALLIELCADLSRFMG
jgi:hypothetical protein